MDPTDQINPYEAPKQVSKSRFPIYVAAGIAIILLTVSSIAFVAYRAAQDQFMHLMNVNRSRIDVHRGPAPDWSEPTLPPDDSTLAVDAPSTEPGAP